MPLHGGASRLSAKPHHFLIGAILAALLLGLEESGDAAHRSAHVAMHPVMLASRAVRRCEQKPATPHTPACEKTEAESGVRPRSN